MKKYLSFDIGGTELKYGILDRSGHLLSKDSVSTDRRDRPSFINQMLEIAAGYKDEIRGICICAPGKIDIHKKIIHFGGTLPFLDGVNMQKELGDKFGVPVGLENDAKAATLAEMWLGELKNTGNGVMLTLGSELGGGIIVHHQLLHGSHYQAGEVSFFPFKRNAKSWSDFTGQQCSAVNMIVKVNTALGINDKYDGRAAFAAINAHDHKAWPIFAKFCTDLAYTILTIQAILDGEKIVIAGGISAQPIVLKTINEAYDELTGKIYRLQHEFTRPEIVRARFGSEANLYGALYALLLESSGQIEWTNIR